MITLGEAVQVDVTFQCFEGWECDVMIILLPITE